MLRKVALFDCKTCALTRGERSTLWNIPHTTNPSLSIRVSLCVIYCTLSKKYDRSHVPEWISSDNNMRSRGSRTAKAARNILAPASDPGSPRSPGMLRDDDALGAARRSATRRGRRRRSTYLLSPATVVTGDESSSLLTQDGWEKGKDNRVHNVILVNTRSR